jgi:hypothetical protein
MATRPAKDSDIRYTVMLASSPYEQIPMNKICGMIAVLAIISGAIYMADRRWPRPRAGTARAGHVRACWQIKVRTAALLDAS